jgi:hypothetical protein
MVSAGAVPTAEIVASHSDSWHGLIGVGRIRRDRAPSDRREAYRLALTPGRARVELPEAGPLDLRDLSATGSSVIWAGADSNAAGILSATFHLPDEPAFRADLRIIRRVQDAQGESAVGTQFSGLDHTALRSLSRFMVREHMQRGVDLNRLVENRRALRIRDAGYISRLLEVSAIHEQRLLQAFAPGQELPIRVQLTALAVDGRKDVLVGLMGGDAAEVVKGAELMFLLPGRSSVALFNSRILDRRDQRLLLSLPTEIFQTGFRDSHRTPLADPGSVRVSFRHPHLVGRRLERGTLDVAARGLAFPANTEHDLLFPGDRLPDLQIALPSGEVLTTTGIIRGMRGAALGVDCGVELQPFATEWEQRRWHQFVFQAAHPRLQQAGARDLNAVWQVFENSNYVNKWIDSDVSSQVRQEFKRSWQGAASRGGEILLLNGQERALGTISANQVYPRTWLMHSLAVDKQARAGVQRAEFLGLARELYSGIMYTLQHQASTRYFLAYFEESKSWNQRLYRDFARDYVARGDQSYDPVFVYKLQPGAPAPVPLPPPSNVVVVRADAEHRCLVAASARNTRSPIVVDGMALDESILDLQSFSQACADAGIERSRQVLMVIENGQPVLAAICEGGSAGINVFGLMNLCWTIPIGNTPASDAATWALFEAVRAHYRDAGAAEVVLIEENESRRSFLESLGYRFVSPGIRWLARVHVLPAWLSYVENELTADRSPRPSDSVG